MTFPNMENILVRQNNCVFSKEEGIKVEYSIKQQQKGIKRFEINQMVVRCMLEVLTKT